MNTCISTLIKPLTEISAADEPRCGAKAYNCARLRQAGFRVPDGAVVLSDVADADLEAVAFDPWFDTFPSDARFAVRSSGIGEDGEGQSFAGIHETVLNVRREEICNAVAVCRASARSPQALEYRRAKGLSTSDIRMGVFIQQMIQPIASGVAFTVNPVTRAGNELVINSSWGIGEALVSGQVDPDEFVVRKTDGALLWSRTGEKGAAAFEPQLASLSTEQVQELAGILIGIEQHYGSPQDVEWCHDDSGFWIVQSRPVTTGTNSNGKSEIEWTRANLVEVLPDLTSPQALASFEEMLNRSERQYLGRLAAPESALGPMLKVFHGRLYFNLSQVRRVCALGGMAPAEMLRSMGHAEAIQPADEKATRLGVRESLSAVPGLFRIVWKHVRVARTVRKHDDLTKQELSRFLRNPSSLVDDEICTAIEQWAESSPKTMQTVLLLSGVLFHELPLRKICDKVGFSFESLVYPQLAVGKRSVSAQQAFDLTRLADIARRSPAAAEWFAGDELDVDEMRRKLDGTLFLATFDYFLRQYGHRGRYESDWSLPRYQEDPKPLLQAIRTHLQGGSEKTAAEVVERQRQESDSAWDSFTQRLSRWQTLTALPRVRSSIRKIKQYYLWREQVRSDLMRVVARVREWSLALAQRFVTRGWIESIDDYFLLQLNEVAEAIRGIREPGTLREVVTRRKAELARQRAVQMPLLMRESELPALIRTAGISSRSADESQLQGYPVSGGCVEAEVVVVRDASDFTRMKPGAILVAPATDPSWTPLFTLASGVVVEVGGVLSHASTVAREYGLPALANVKHATRRLKTGEKVRLDATQGVIHRL